MPYAAPCSIRISPATVNDTDAFTYFLQYKTVSPVGDRVYVKVDVSEEKTSSGLLLPVSAQKKPTQGEIVGAGTAKAVKVSNSSAFAISITDARV